MNNCTKPSLVQVVFTKFYWFWLVVGGFGWLRVLQLTIDINDIGNKIIVHSSIMMKSADNLMMRYNFIGTFRLLCVEQDHEELTTQIKSRILTLKKRNRIGTAQA